MISLLALLVAMNASPSPPTGAQCNTSPYRVHEHAMTALGVEVDIDDINTIYESGIILGWLYHGIDKKRYVVYSSAAIGARSGPYNLPQSAAAAPSIMLAFDGRLPRGAKVVRCFATGRRLSATTVTPR